jgi:hypothetical protein
MVLTLYSSSHILSPPSPRPLLAEWNSNFAVQGRGSLKSPHPSSSAGLEASDSRWNEAVRSTQFSSVPVPSYRTHTTQFDNALGGRGEFGVGRNWTGNSVGAKGLRHDLQQDAIRTTFLLRELPSDCYQVREDSPHRTLLIPLLRSSTVWRGISS